MNIYCFSGLGADYRVLNRLDLSPHHLIHMDWIKPKKTESLKDYAIRLSETIEPTDEFAILGLSFGGMIAIEAAKYLQAKNVILLSTIAKKHEIPKRYQLIRFLRLHRIVPYRFLKKYHSIDNYLFGISKRADIKLFKQILLDTDVDLLRWAVHAILHWQNEEDVNALRIHGRNDQIIPPKSFMKMDYLIQGGHLLPLTATKKVKELIFGFINK